MRQYELTYILRPDLEASAINALVERINGYITAEGGAVSKVVPWGLRTLTYPIRKQREGYYVFTLFTLDAAAVARFEQRLRLMEDVLRYLIVRTDEDEEDLETNETTSETAAAPEHA